MEFEVLGGGGEGAWLVFCISQGYIHIVGTLSSILNLICVQSLVGCYPFAPVLTDSVAENKTHNSNKMSSFRTFVFLTRLERSAVEECVVTLFRDCSLCGRRRNVLVRV